MSKKTHIAAILFVVLALPVFCRDITVKVSDEELDMPLEGAQVRLQNGKIYRCDPLGNAYFHIEDGSAATIEITYPGYTRYKTTIRDSKTTYSFSLKLEGTVLQDEGTTVEGRRKAEAEADTGRSISLDRDSTELASEIGIIEDIMSSIKLLPGVGYTGTMGGQPSIRGGTPGDMIAVMDGFYVDNPYHWGGSFSIFDPKIVESARLYHGVFSAKYGQSVSGILDVKSKKASMEEASFEVGFSTSAASLAVSMPLSFSSGEEAKGGIMIMGKITYWDPFVWLAKGLAEFVEILEPIKSVNVPPYIRCAAVSLNYDPTPKLGVTFNTYIGADGVGALYEGNNSLDIPVSHLEFTWDNLIFYATGRLTYANSFLTSATTLGAGFHNSTVVADIIFYEEGDLLTEEYDTFVNDVANFQVRSDFDIDLTKGFFLSVGVEEVYRNWVRNMETNAKQAVATVGDDGSRKIISVDYFMPEISNHGFFTSGWAIGEYKDPKERFYVEAGLRADLLSFFVGDNYVDCPIAINPRFNFDYYLLKDKGLINGMTLTAGTGLFSSSNDDITYVDEEVGIQTGEIKQTRSWTSILGINIEFADNYSFNLEFYYKYVFDRVYSKSVVESLHGEDLTVTKYYFDGISHIYGFDFMLHKMKGRFISGWISYTFTYARYKNPQSEYAFENAKFRDDYEDHWFFPDFHRYSYLNLVLNWTITKNFNLYTRFGIATGVPELEHGTPEVTNKEEVAAGAKPKYGRTNIYSDTARTDWILNKETGKYEWSPTMPLDIKFSWFIINPNGKAQTEVYFAVENLLSLISSLRPKSGTTLNPNTGEEVEGGQTANYGLPIPMISFGFKWSY
ncbi:MAG: hypothetical protein Ta2G_05550 [Termitinemataceae bacterium]|nr:MAG: hypothetical protein Ta2G_05550 [Termitinemataceae bacterium]